MSTGGTWFDGESILIREDGILNAGRRMGRKDINLRATVS